MDHQAVEKIGELIFQLRKQLEDLVVEENELFDNYFYLYRWLLANQMKLDRTKKAIRDAIVWRKAFNVEELGNQDYAYWDPELKKAGCCYDFDGIAKTGQPVTTFTQENMNTRDLIQKFGKDTFIRAYVQFFIKHEKLMMRIYKEGPSVNSKLFESFCSNMEKKQCSKTGYNPSWYFAAPIHIVSYKNFSLKNATHYEGAQAMVEIAKFGMNYFPCLVSQLYVVNLNKVSNMVVKLLKPLLQSDSFKMEFYDTDYTKWSKALLEKIDADQIEPYFGGTKIVTERRF